MWRDRWRFTVWNKKCSHSPSTVDSAMSLWSFQRFAASSHIFCSLESRHATIWSTKNCVCFLLDHHKPLLLEMVVGRFTYQEVYWRLQITSWDHSFLMVPPDNLLRNLTGYANKNICICLGTSMCTLEVNHHFKNDASFWMMINLYVIKKCGFFQPTGLKNDKKRWPVGLPGCIFTQVLQLPW